MAADTNVNLNIINRVTGLSQLKSLDKGMGGISQKIKRQAANNLILHKGTKAINKQLKKEKGVYRKLSESQVANIANINKEQKFAKKLGISRGQLAMGLKRTGTVLGEDNKLHRDTGISIKDQSTAQAELIGKTKRFRMELLSVMFFGMAVARIFGAMTKGSLEAAGAMDVWSTVTMLFGLPGAEAIREAGFAALSVFDAMPVPLQVAGSYLAFLGQAAGTALMSLGMFGLGYQGLMQMFPVWSVAVNTAGGLFPWLWGTIKAGAPVMAKIASWVTIVWGVFRGLGGFIKGDWFKAVSGTLLVIGGIVALVMGGWIPAAIAGAIGLLVMFGDKFEWIRKTIMTVISPLSYLLSLVMNLGDTFRTGNWGGFWGRVNELGSAGTFFGGETKMQAGGIVTGPTHALIGEAGPEAVIPLSGAGAGIGGLVYSPTININANISNDADINSLASRLNDILYTELRRLGVR